MSSPLWSSSISLPVGVTGKKIIAENGNSWLLTTAGEVHKYSFGTWSAMYAPATLDKLSVATDASAIAIANDSTVHFYDGIYWTSMGVLATAVAIGDSSSYIIANGSIITAYQTSGTKDIKISAAVTLKQISATANLDHVWGVDTTGAIYSLTGTSWSSISGPPGVSVASVHISVSSGVLQAYCLDGMGNGYWYSGGGWTDVFNPTYWASGFASLQAGVGVAHALMTNGDYYVGTI